jgi:threonylcarbamoyladenosine tRNA methylthiotransferase MtaB
VSVPVEEVVARARTAVGLGHEELVLTGVDIGSYGKHEGTTLAAVIGTLLDRVPEARLRISSINANDVSADLIALNARERLCSHWHIPLQSGSDAVLRAMHRGYRRRQYRRVVEELRTLDPLTEITTDIMVAFPGETDAEHAETLSLMDEIGFLHAHVFRHSPRPGTPARALAGHVDDATARRRSAEVTRAAARTGAASRERAVGRVAEVVWDRITRTEARGTSATWHTVRADPDPRIRSGRRQRVRITGVDGDTLRATLLRI